MGTQQVITVFGATGVQGVGLARSILADRCGPVAVRAVTRDANSPSARALAAAGAEVVAADLGDVAAVPPEVCRGFGFPGADDLGNLFQSERDFNAEFCAARSRAFDPRLQSVAQSLEANASRIPLG